MLAELRTLQSRINALGINAHIGQVPQGTPMPYASLSAPGHDVSDERPLAGPAREVAGDVRVLVTHTTESNVYVALDKIRAALTPDLGPTRLDVPGRYATVEWVRAEFVSTDRDVTYGATNRHPGFGVETYHVDSHPA